MWLYCNKVLKEANDIGIEIRSIRDESNQLIKRRKLLRKDASRSSDVSNLSIKLKQLNSIEESKSVYLDFILSQAHAAYNFVEDIKGAIESGSCFSGDDKGNLIIATDKIYDGEDFVEVSELRQLNLLAKAGRHYPIIRSSKIENERDRFVDTILFNNDLGAISLFPLDEDVKRHALDAAADFLLTKYNDYTINELLNRSLFLEDSGDRSSLLKIIPKPYLNKKIRARK